MQRCAKKVPRLKLPLWKKAAFAIVPAALLVCGTEVTLRLTGYHSPFADPFESFVLHHSLFVAQGTELVTRPQRSVVFHQQRFSARKPPGTYRIFAFGGSVTFGYKLPQPETQSYVALLKEQLQQRTGGTRVQTINCGGCSYASYRLVGLVEECLQYDPDLMIVMTGHNEFLEPRHYKDLFGPATPWRRFWYNLRTVRLMHDVAHRLGRFDVPEPMVRSWVKERYVVRDEAEYHYTLAHFTRNLERIVQACRRQQTPLILCTCPSNLRDWPPFVGQWNGSLPQDEADQMLRRCQQLLDQQRYDAALALARRALDDDPRAAMFHYLAGRCLYALGQYPEAKASLIQAKDNDAFPHRALTSFNNRLRQIARRHHVPLADTEALVMAGAPHGIPGNEQFYDDCHPKPAVHRLWAEHLARQAQELLPSAPGR